MGEGPAPVGAPLICWWLADHDAALRHHARPAHLAHVRGTPSGSDRRDERVVRPGRMDAGSPDNMTGGRNQRLMPLLWKRTFKTCQAQEKPLT